MYLYPQSVLYNCSEGVAPTCSTKNLMVHSFLQLNQGKTEVILFGPSKQTKCLKGSLGPLTSFTKTQVILGFCLMLY